MGGGLGAVRASASRGGGVTAGAGDEEPALRAGCRGVEAHAVMMQTHGMSVIRSMRHAPRPLRTRTTRRELARFEIRIHVAEARIAP